MASEKQQSGRWLRIGTLALTTFAPVLTSIGSRLFRRAKEKDTAIVEEARAGKVSLEKLQALNVALTDVLNDLRTRTRPYRRDLRRRRERVADAVRQRTDSFSHLVAERGSQISHDLAELLQYPQSDRKNDHPSARPLQGLLRKPGKQLTKGRHARREAQALAQRQQAFWISLGFGVGLALAGIVTFRLIRRRHQERQEELLAALGFEDVYGNGEISLPSDGQARPFTTASEQPAATAIPDDAAFLGLVSSKRYYPIETPLDQLASPIVDPIDIVYFSSEEEAQEQGFTAAR